MSAERAKAARAAMKSKAARMANGAGPGDDPSKSIDASGWSEPVANMNAQTGPRPVSPRAYRRGGKVEGHKPTVRADRKPRASGGRGIVDDFINRDAKSANSLLGKPHIGAYASGGSANFRKQMHSEMGKTCRTPKRDGGGKWIAGAIKHPGALHKELGVPQGEKIPAKKLNKAAHSDNPKLAKRANLAKTLDRMHKAAGGSTQADSTGMRPKGDRIPRAMGGRSKGKGKTNIIIGIHANPPQQQTPPMAAPVRPPSQPVPVPTPMPQGMPMGAPPMGGMGGGMPPPGMMARKSGGRVYEDASVEKAEKVKSIENMPAGGGSGLGRLAKRSVTQRTYERPV